ncbi:4'-phosphopantetheinyl transferase superfamily protein [Streptomyces sp. AP-93]|uniref:4'-phosphopantetheinyl transferase family protein n=1 Tax=Streptomyces sp. AP-93 TaxID=2929048 RepID=UPI001FAF2062|nr:4'-phosphopantetheinyl transferase superfamily protein [Streptomyces sp. AP-93]MCJ0871770.1 4'-phosphopantetheinyl transferase superfamily protein [Streptomyces sp. AP-93]
MNTVKYDYQSLLEADAVHIWQGRAPDEMDPADLLLLSDQELRVVERRSEQAGARYASAHAALRRILAGYLDVAPDAIRLGRRPCPRCEHPEHGRPRVDWPETGLDFNLSRSGPHWLLAVVAGRQVGVDIEDSRHLDLHGSSALVMSDSELERLAAAGSDEARSEVFFRCWTRKEAVVKACGVGIITDLRSIDVRLTERGPVTVTHVEPSGPDTWTVQDLPVAAPLFAAVAQEAGSTGPVVLRRVDEGVLSS